MESETHDKTIAQPSCNNIIGETMYCTVVTSSDCLVNEGRINLGNDITLDRYYPFIWQGWHKW